jgi:hypothetical protein
MTLVYGLAIFLGAVLGFGMAGMSASFGGWPAGLAVVAGLGGAALLVALGLRYAPIGGE